jgi:GNAT superfamily N-acetyltransferase
MSFDILPQTADDAPEIFIGARKAFTRFNKILFNPFPLSAESMEILSKRRVESFSKNPQAKNFKAVDRETGAIIGAARWSIHAEEEEIDKTVEEESEGGVEAFRVPELREEVASAFYTGLLEGKREIMGIKDDDGKVTKLKPRVDLEFLFTHPDHQGKGVGKALLQRCIQDAEALGLVAYLEATEEGLPLYAKNGFESIRTNVFDAKEFGFEGTHQYTVCLVLCMPFLSDTY